jgi:AP-3 complex subunit mu
LVATYTSKGNIKNGNFIACLKFLVNNFAASSTKIEKVEVRNGAKSLSKKAKNITKSGYYEIRLN